MGSISSRLEGPGNRGQLAPVIREVDLKDAVLVGIQGPWTAGVLKIAIAGL